MSTQPATRDVVCCQRCKLTQFRTAADICRRCKASTAPPPGPAPPLPEPIIVPAFAQRSGDALALAVADALKQARKKSGMGQRQMARAMNVPRTYISKVENGRSFPSLASMVKFAAALKISLTQLIEQIDCRRLLIELARKGEADA